MRQFRDYLWNQNAKLGSLACLVILATVAPSETFASTTIRCFLEAPSNKVSKFLPDWIDIERNDDQSLIFVRDQYMTENEISKIRAKVSRENEKILGVSWKGYAVSAGFNKNPIHPNFRLSIVKSTLRARLSHSAKRGSTNLSAKAKCQRL